MNNQGRGTGCDRASFYGIVPQEGVVSIPVPPDVAKRLDEGGPDANNVPTGNGGRVLSPVTGSHYRDVD